MKHLRRFNESIEQIVSKIDSERSKILNYWSDYYGSDEKAADELDYYISDLEHKYKHGGSLFRVVFINDESELNLDDLGMSWIMDKWYLDYFIGNHWMYYGKGKKHAYVFEVITEPNNVTIPSDLRGNPEEKEVNIIDMSRVKLKNLWSYYGKELNIVKSFD